VPAFREIFEALAGASLPDWTVATQATQVVRVAAGAPVFLADAVRPHVFCVRAGVVKLQYDTIDGKQWIKAFVDEGRFFASASALEPGGRTSFAAIAVVATVVDQLDFAALEALATRHPLWQRALTHAFRLYGRRKEERERDLLTRTASERYLRFLAESPGIEARISQKDLASYVGVTPVALSRIKRRLRTRSSSGPPSGDGVAR
jgi:CRP-like cAMP-binding protein